MSLSPPDRERSTVAPPPAVRRALVTGAGRGIGRATALALADAGVRVLGVSRTASELDALAAVAAVEVHAASLADRDGCAAVATVALERLGGVDPGALERHDDLRRAVT